MWGGPGALLLLLLAQGDWVGRSGRKNQAPQSRRRGARSGALRSWGSQCVAGVMCETCCWQLCTHENEKRGTHRLRTPSSHPSDSPNKRFAFWAPLAATVAIVGKHPGRYDGEDPTSALKPTPTPNAGTCFAIHPIVVHPVGWMRYAAHRDGMCLSLGACVGIVFVAILEGLPPQHLPNTP